MDKDEERRLLADLPVSARRVVERFTDYPREKILDKLASGFRITICDSWYVEVNKGYTYYHIERSGRMYQV